VLFYVFLRKGEDFIVRNCV